MSGFHRGRTNRDGLQRQCKKCSRAYYEAHRNEIRDRSSAYREAHREEIRDRDRAYYEAHREERTAKQRAYKEAHRNEIRDRDRAYREAHNAERNAQIRKRRTEASKASREVATRNGEPWTPAEDCVVLTLKATALDIAIELGRTTSSVHNRRALLRRKAVTA